MHVFHQWSASLTIDVESDQHQDYAAEVMTDKLKSIPGLRQHNIKRQYIDEKKLIIQQTQTDHAQTVTTSKGIRAQVLPREYLKRESDSTRELRDKRRKKQNVFGPTGPFGNRLSRQFNFFPGYYLLLNYQRNRAPSQPQTLNWVSWTATSRVVPRTTQRRGKSCYTVTLSDKLALQPIWDGSHSHDNAPREMLSKYTLARNVCTGRGTPSATCTI